VSFPRLYAVVGGYFRRERWRWLLTEFAECITVVDMGGTVAGWDGSGSLGLRKVTLVNPAPNPFRLPLGFCYLQADACRAALPGTFDLAYSNSAIEHLGTWEHQREFAGEMHRLGRRIYCQTPNRWFPIEPHYLTAFLHWLPSRWFGYWAHRYLTLQGLAQRPSSDESHHIRSLEAVRFLSKRELRELFPDCQIRVERFLGWPKSYTAWK
jgi:hypothetical protein